MEKRERERERERARRREEEGGRHAARAAQHPVDPIFFKRSAHSSQPDSLTIIKRKSLYSALSFRPRTYFLPSPVSTSPLAPVLSPRLPRCALIAPSLRFRASPFNAVLLSSPFLTRRPPRSSRSFSSSRSLRYCSHCAADYFIIQLLSFARQKAPSPATQRIEDGARASAKMGKGWKS